MPCLLLLITDHKLLVLHNVFQMLLHNAGFSCGVIFITETSVDLTHLKPCELPDEHGASGSADMFKPECCMLSILSVAYTTKWRCSAQQHAT